MWSLKFVDTVLLEKNVYPDYSSRQHCSGRFKIARIHWSYTCCNILQLNILDYEVTVLHHAGFVNDFFCFLDKLQ